MKTQRGDTDSEQQLKEAHFDANVGEAMAARQSSQFKRDQELVEG